MEAPLAKKHKGESHDLKLFASPNEEEARSSPQITNSDLGIIFSYCDWVTLVSAEKVSHQWREVSSSNFLWYPIVIANLCSQSPRADSFPFRNVPPKFYRNFFHYVVVDASKALEYIRLVQHFRWEDVLPRRDLPPAVSVEKLSDQAKACASLQRWVKCAPSSFLFDLYTDVSEPVPYCLSTLFTNYVDSATNLTNGLKTLHSHFFWFNPTNPQLFAEVLFSWKEEHVMDLSRNFRCQFRVRLIDLVKGTHKQLNIKPAADHQTDTVWLDFNGTKILRFLTKDIRSIAEFLNTTPSDIILRLAQYLLEGKPAKKEDCYQGYLDVTFNPELNDRYVRCRAMSDALSPKFRSGNVPKVIEHMQTIQVKQYSENAYVDGDRMGCRVEVTFDIKVPSPAYAVGAQASLTIESPNQAVVLVITPWKLVYGRDLEQFSICFGNSETLAMTLKQDCDRIVKAMWGDSSAIDLLQNIILLMGMEQIILFDSTLRLSIDWSNLKKLPIMKDREISAQTKFDAFGKILHTIEAQ
eukprot:TRINITY_DN2762_c0_g1_i1.p1 TRINITY_DN2762_c0_g1~~TRINITY_DN2762_c0_g1_i1.p1  ORF type:complete len:524 (-),score=114.14 TRINITY_DN2762_c0_g1_i1:174-1745(-)